MGTSEGRIDFGTFEMESNFTLSFWISPSNTDSNGTRMIAKDGLPGMDIFKIEKNDNNGTVKVFLYLDGLSEELILSTDSEVLTDEVWTHLSITYEDVNGSLSIYADGLLLGQSSGHHFTGAEISSRFSTLTLGGGSLPIDALFDDLRIYSDCLTPLEISTI